MYPTAAHEKRGKEVGLSVSAVEAIIGGRTVSFEDAREQVVYEVAVALAGGHLVPQGLYERAIKVLGHEGVTDMIVLMGYYTAVSLTMNFYAVPAGSPGLARCDEACYGSTTDRATSSVARRRGCRCRPQQAHRRADPGCTLRGTRRASGAGISRPDPHADSVSCRGEEPVSPPMEQHYSQHNMPDFPLIGLIWHGNGQRPAEQWHTDHTNGQRPPAATILYGVEIASAGGGTSVANMRAAYDILPRRRTRASGITEDAQQPGGAIVPTRVPKDRDKYGTPIEHPMVRSHPVHGSRAVYFHISKATHIGGHDTRGEPGPT